MDKAGLVLLGAGGHASSCRDIVESIWDYSISLGGRITMDAVVQDTRTITDAQWRYYCEYFAGFILGIGQIHSPENRERVVVTVKGYGGNFVTLISPFARVSPKAYIGEGTIVMPGACVNAGAKIGDFVILNTGCIVEHDAEVYGFSHISTGAVINGDCVVGPRCFIGSNAVLLNQIIVRKETTVGAGSVVTKNIEDENSIYVGNPATFVRKKT